MFIRGSKLNISLVFITQSFFKVRKDIRLNTIHFLISKIPNKRELQQIAINHSSDISTKDFEHIYKNCTAEPYSFLVNETTLPSNDPLRFRKNLFNICNKKFLSEIRERELISKNISKYIASLDYFDKSLNVLSILSGSISIASFATLIGATAGIIGASYSSAFSITSGFVKKFLKTIRNKKKKHNKIVMLARSKLNSIESKIPKALMDNEVSH